VGLRPRALLENAVLHNCGELAQLIGRRGTEWTLNDWAERLQLSNSPSFYFSFFILLYLFYYIILFYLFYFLGAWRWRAQICRADCQHVRSQRSVVFGKYRAS